MSLKDNWKNTGKELGSAFGGLGKTILKSAEQVVDDVDDSVENRPQNPNESTVFNDGSWRQVGKGLGSAFASLGKSTVKSIKVGVDKALEEDNTETQNENNCCDCCNNK